MLRARESATMVPTQLRPPAGPQRRFTLAIPESLGWPALDEQRIPETISRSSVHLVRLAPPQLREAVGPALAGLLVAALLVLGLRQ